MYSCRTRVRGRLLLLKLILSLSLLFNLASAGLAFGQTIHLPPSVRQGPDTASVPVRTQEEADRERIKKANELRQEEIKRDTEKLFQLSTELKDFVDKSNQGILSLDALKKAEQIEKLARSVKSKIKQSY